MFDTINMWLPIEQAGTKDLLAHIAKHIQAPTEHYKGTGEVYLTGHVGANYRATVSHTGLTLKGSLAKYYLVDNFHTLTRSDSARAINMMSDELHLPIEKAKVSRIDFSQNFLMKYEPEAYYSYLGECQHYNRLPQARSLYYSNGLRQKLFYNKIAEGKSKGLSLPNIWSGQNVLRYEFRLTSRLPKQFNLPLITASTLSEEKFYMDLFDKWQAEYEAIHKLNTLNFNMSDMNSPKDYIKQLALSGIQSKGQQNVMQEIENMRAMNVFDKPEYYSRLKKEIRELCKKPDMTTSSELIEELDKKIKSAKRYYR